MIKGRDLLLKVWSAVGMLLAIIVIIRITPVPDQKFQSCNRPCHELDWPMICRFKLNVEILPSKDICQSCENNSTTCNTPLCPSSKGIPKHIITANRQLPGPSIQVCHNDIVIVDVVNKIPGHSLTMHWKGQQNTEAPFMDGVPMVTQCPIASYTTFQYKVRASTPGTHFYHTYSHTSGLNGLFGALVVRQPDNLEPHSNQYDLDLKEHVLMLSEWFDSSNPKNSEKPIPSAILINGRDASINANSPTVISVQPKKRHRFRIAYANGLTGCPVTLTVDNHLLKVISIDGHPIQPSDVSPVVISKGERVDFVLDANQDAGVHFLKATSHCNGKTVSGSAMVTYEGTKSSKKALSLPKKLMRFDTAVCKDKVGTVCLNDAKSLKQIAPALKDLEVDKKFYLSYDHHHIELDSTEGGWGDARSKIYKTNNISFVYPPSPLLTQVTDVPDNMICREDEVPDKCKGKEICECVHLEIIPLGSSTEIVLIDQGNDTDEHIFHLHGHHFYVVGHATFGKTITRQEVLKLDANNKLLNRNLINPVVKDTIRVPKNGVVVIRFVAENPGFWMLRDELSQGWTRGMDIIFQVGDGYVVSTPSNFPTCGNFIGPDFFLM